MRPVSRFFALFCLTSACSGAHGSGAPPAHASRAPDVAGEYRVRGDLFGGALEERIALTPRGAVFSAVRATSDGSVTAAGVAIAEGDRLVAALGPRSASVDLVVLESSEEGVHGTWAYGGKGSLGTETWTGAPTSDDPFVGTFHTAGTDAESGEPYQGSVTVTKDADRYALVWTTGDVVCHGRGLRDGKSLVVVGEGETGVPSAGARLPSGDALLGVYRRSGTTYDGTTTILRGNGGYESATEVLERR